MNSYDMQNKKIAKIGIFTISAKAVSLIKCSFVFGTLAGFFSGVNAISPLAGAFGGGLGAVAFGAERMVWALLFGGLTFKIFANSIPGLFAGLYWAYPSFATRVLVPLTCMILFIAQPVGGQAFVYSLYWLIPVALYFVPKENLFLTALGSTFIAHAVGSAIWIYAEPMTPSVWYALLPIVAVERLLFATSMVVCHNVLSAVFAQVNISTAFARVRRFVSAQ
jgi:hypothetical protein